MIPTSLRIEFSLNYVSLLLTVVFFTLTSRAYSQQSENTLVVTETQSVPEFPAEANTTLKSPLPIQITPASVQIVPRNVIEERQAQTASQAVDTVSGIESNNAVPGSQSFRIRGFSDGNGNLRDCFRETSNQQDVVGIERIDVLKGPAAVLYGGSLASGGVVNIITKSPVDNDFNHLGLIAGSRDLRRMVFDINHNLTSDRSVILRIDGAGDRSNSFRQKGDNGNAFINPSLLWRPTYQDEVLFRAQYYHSDFNYGEYQSPNAQPVLKLPLSFNFDNPNQRQSRKDAGRASYDWTHNFDSGIKFRSGFNLSRVKYDFGTDRMSQLSLLPDGHTVRRVAQSGPQKIHDYDWQNEFSGVFSTNEVIHQWLVGIESYRSSNDSIGYQTRLPNLDLNMPVYHIPVIPGRLTSSTYTSFNDYGGYVQDVISPSLKWHILVGGRYDLTESKSLNRLSDVNISNRSNKFSPRFGLTYEPVPGTALYLSWANSFIPTTATTASGSPLSPSSSEQYEAGIKQQVFDQRLQMTLAVYQLARKNVPTVNPNNTLYSVATGKQRSRGIEADISGEILPGWTTTASYAWTFANVLEDNRFPEGDILAGVPRYAANLWTSYSFQSGLLQGAGSGVGIRSESAQQATLPNSYNLPGYARFDAAIWYHFTVDQRTWKIQINLQNITDKRIYATDGSRTLRAQQPRTVIAQLSADF